jgi:hypothetical protein
MSRFAAANRIAQNAGVTEIILSTGYQPHAIEKALVTVRLTAFV